jgi:hypothetical protein
MRFYSLAISLIIPLIFSLESQAGQLGDGTVFFNKSPRLIDAITTFKSVRVWYPTYYFTIELPPDIEEPLQKITVQQRQGYESIDFHVEETVAFAGTPNNRGESFTIKSTKFAPDTNTISVIFEPPIPPGTLLTLGLKPWRNPEFDGIYLFGVTAFPSGEKTQGLYLGVGRLQFYRGDGSSW